MAMNKNVYQVIFLVDLSAGVPEGEDDSKSEKILNCIRLGCLKILTYFSNKLHPEVKLKNIRWGFKFYNSVSLCLKVANYHFSEFTLKKFEEFENELESRFEAERLKCHGLVRNKNAHPSHSEQKSVHEVPLVDDDDSIEKLKKSLREICQDFLWDRPDICSPVRPLKGRGRTKNSIHLEESRQYNYVFLFSPCPHSVGEVHEFCDSEGPLQPNDILESFMPHSMYKAFYEQSKINLFWIDVDCSPHKDYVANLGGMDIVHSSLQMLGGGVLPINAILHLGTSANTLIPHLFCPSHTSHREGSSSENLAEIVNEGCTGVDANNASFSGEEGTGSVSELVMSATRVLEYYTSLPFISPTIDDKGELGLMVAGEGTDQQILGQVALKPLVLGSDNPCKRKLQSKLSIQGSFPSSVAEDRLKVTILPSVCTAKHKFQQNEENSVQVTLNHQIKCDRDSVEGPDVFRTIEVRGTLTQSDMPLEAFQADLVLSLTAVAGQGWEDFSFSQLMLQLSKLRLVLVVDYYHSHSPLPSTCILQPLTSVSATLTFVKSDMNLVLEKLLSFGRKSPAKPQQQDIQAFVDNTVTSLLKAKKGRRKPQEAVLMPPDVQNMPVSSDTLIKEPFKPSFLESWCLPGILTGNSDKLLNVLRESETSLQGQELESTTLKHLQQHYRNLASVSTISTCGTRNPKKTPRKVGSSPRKGNRKTPRKTPGKSASPRKSPRKKSTLSGKAFAPVRRSPRKAELKRVKSLTGPIRSASIIARSHQVVAQQIVTEDSETERGKIKSARQNTKRVTSVKIKQDFHDETDLLSHLKKNYEEGMETSGTPLFCAQSIVNVALHFIRCTEAPEAEKKAQEFLREHLMMTSKQVREKHAKLGQSIDVNSKIQEFQLQVLLYLEVEALLPCEPMENTVEEVVNMLRSMSFLRDPNYLTSYVNDVLVENYKDSLAPFLGQIYDGLLLPMPAQLETLLSPDEDEDGTSMDGSVMPPSYKSDTSVMYPSLGCESNMNLRSRKMAHFPSFDGVPKRQIAVPNLKKPKDKETCRMRTRSAKKKKKIVDPKPEKQMVRRILFDGGSKGVRLERRASLAVMESTHSLSFGRGRGVPTTPKAHHILKTSNVAETPSHKQKANLLWRKQEKERRRTHTLADILVVEESPQKMPSQLTALRKSPRRASLGSVGLTRRQSFYSDAPQGKSRNLVKFEKNKGLFEARMTTKSNTSPTGSQQVLKTSPTRRIKPVSLFSQLLSPSPPKRFAGFMSPTKQTASKRLYENSPIKNTRSRISLMSPQKMSAIRKIGPDFESPSKHTRSKSLRISPPNQHSPRQLMADFDSPSKHTRSRSMMSPDKGRKLLVCTPKKEDSSQNSFLALKSPTRAVSFPSPSKVRSSMFTPGKQCFTPGRPCLTPSRMARSGLLLSPGGKATTPKQPKTPNYASAMPKMNIRPTFKQKLFAESMHPEFTSPSKNTRFQTNKKSSPSDPKSCDDNQSKSSLGITSGQEVLTASTDGKSHRPRRLQTDFEDIDKENMASIKPFGDQFQNVNSIEEFGLLSPRRSGRISRRLDSTSPLQGQKQLSLNVCTPPKDQITNILSTVSPPSNTKGSQQIIDISQSDIAKDSKVIKTPDSLDKWPRRKQRHFMQSTSAKDSTFLPEIPVNKLDEKSEMQPNQMDSRDSDFANENISPDIKRKVKSKHSGSKHRKTGTLSMSRGLSESGESMNTSKKEYVFQDQDMSASVGLIPVPNSTPSSKRKRSPRGADAEIMSQIDIVGGTPSKRRRTTLSSRGSFSATSQDYFDSQEVFLEGSNSSLRSPQRQQSHQQIQLARRMGSYDSDSRFSWADMEDSRESAVFNSRIENQRHLLSRLNSNSDSGSSCTTRSKQWQNHRASGISESGSNIGSECIPSPVFDNSRQNIFLRSQSGETSEYASDSNMSGPVSPVFHPAVSKIRKYLESENESSFSSTSAVVGSPPQSTHASSSNSSPTSIKTSNSTRCTPEVRKYSPSVSAMSLAHLISSPLVDTSSSGSKSSAMSEVQANSGLDELTENVLESSNDRTRRDRKSRRALNMT